MCAHNEHHASRHLDVMLANNQDVARYARFTYMWNLWVHTSRLQCIFSVSW